MSAAPESIVALASQRYDETPEKAAYCDPVGGAITFAEMWSETQRVASGMLELGVGRGDTLSFQLPNWHEAAVINLAAAYIGARINPITPIYREAELTNILADSGSKLIFCAESFRGVSYGALIEKAAVSLPNPPKIVVVRGSSSSNLKFEELGRGGDTGREAPAANLQLSDEKLLMYTSGTTGRPKGVVHSHASVFAFSQPCIEKWGMGPDDLMLMASPVTHVTGYMYGVELPFLSGATVLLMDRWDAAAAVQLIDRFGVTICSGATPFLKELLDEAEKQNSRLESLRIFPSGGASSTPDLIRLASKQTAKCRAFRIYGATEAPMVTIGAISDEALGAETDGLMSDYDVKIVNRENEISPPGQPGEICVKGPGMFVKYTNPKDTEAALDKDGYFRTGDLGVLTEEGAIKVTGRLKDIIIRGGENLSPAEIEEAIQRHPGITEAAVVGMPHKRLGESVAAFLIARPDSDQLNVKELSDFIVEQGLAKQKSPEWIHYVDDLPRTQSGKVQKEVLRKKVIELLQRETENS